MAFNDKNIFSQGKFKPVKRRDRAALLRPGVHLPEANGMELNITNYKNKELQTCNKTTELALSPRKIYSKRVGRQVRTPLVARQEE